MAKKELLTNLKVIKSGTVPTTATLPDGHLAFGKIGGAPKIYGNSDGAVTEYGVSKEELIALLANKAEINQPDFIGGISSNTPNAGIEWGSKNIPNTPFIDFHTGGGDVDYDSRIIADGKNINIDAGILAVRGRRVLLEGEGGGSTVINDSLTSASTTEALSANQGRVLNNDKQATLVSGTNIRSINGQSLLGSGNIEISSGGGTMQQVYDVVIRTQAEFVALYSSSTWLNAKSVAFIGDGGTLEFTRATYGLKIPNTVKNIVGLNSAKIRIIDFAGYTGNLGGVFYETIPINGEHSVTGLTLIINATGITSGFRNCSQVTNCVCVCTATLSCSGFYGCTGLTNCISTSTSTGAATSYGFNACKQLTHCDGTGISGASSGYGFNSCAFLNGCKEGITLSTTGIWGGTNTFRDDQSCQLVR